MEKYTENSGINSGWPRLLPSPIPPSPSLDVRGPKSGQRIRETYKPQHTVVLRVSTQSSRFRYSGWIGEHGGHRQGPYVCEYSEVLLSHEFGTRSFFIAASPSSSSRQVLRDLEVGYVRLHRQRLCGSVIPAIGLQGYVSDDFSVTALLDR